MNDFWRTLALVASMLLPGLDAVAADPFFAGRTITILVGFGPNGSDDSSLASIRAGGAGQRLTPEPTYDLTADLYARHLGRFLPGRPSVATASMPGAASLRAARYLQSTAPKDGTLLAILGPAVIRQRLASGQPGLIDARLFGWIGSRTREIYICAIRRGAGVGTPDDLRKRKVFFGATDPRSRPFLHASAANLVLGGRLAVVPGYAHVDEILTAMQKEEVDGLCGISLSALRGRYGGWLASGALKPIAQFGQEKDPRLAYLPTMTDYLAADRHAGLVRLFDDEGLYTWPFAAPPGLPPERLAQLRWAFDAMMRDPEVLADAGTMGLPLDFVSGEELADAARRMMEAPAEAITTTRKLSGLD